ncbi:ATP-binding cassette domain-containing protein, partial [Staphylococcus pasteuri]
MIEAEHIVKYFHETMALNDVSLTIEEAKCTALIGKNGAGKSTLIDIIIGNKNYKSGEIID